MKLVMEENERKEVQPSNQESNFRHEKKFTLYKSVKETYSREEGAGDCCDSMREMQTLPFRTDVLRAKFQERIDEEKKLTTTALVERPPNWNKEEFEKRKRHVEGRAVDTPDDTGAPEGHRFVGYRGSIGSDSKDRPLVVRLPEPNENGVSEERKESLNIENLPSRDGQQPEKDVQSSTDDTSDQREEEPENDCIVNCLYYTQQFCDCSIL